METFTRRGFCDTNPSKWSYNRMERKKSDVLGKYSFLSSNLGNSENVFIKQVGCSEELCEKGENLGKESKGGEERCKEKERRNHEKRKQENEEDWRKESIKNDEKRSIDKANEQLKKMGRIGRITDEKEKVEKKSNVIIGDEEKKRIKYKEVIFVSSTKVFTIYYSPKRKIIDIKKEIENKTGIPIKDQLLTLSGKYLEDQKILWEYNIQKEATLNLSIKFLGGENVIFNFLNNFN